MEFNEQNDSKVYNLEVRTFLFAQKIRDFVKRIPKSIGNMDDSRQLIRSSGSVGANYIEANDSLGKNDFLMHIRICRKESKESSYFLRLLDLAGNSELIKERLKLVDEANRLMKIFGAILKKAR